MVRSYAKEFLHVTKGAICCIVVATLLLVSYSLNPVGQEDTKPTILPEEGIAISSDSPIVLSAVMAQLLASSEPVSVQTTHGSAVLGYQSKNDSLDELLELQTGKDTITWFSKSTANAKRKMQNGKFSVCTGRNLGGICA